MSKNAAWLELTLEETLEPDLPICDPHHHLWEFRDEWIAPRYLMDELQADLRTGHNIRSTIFIECGTMYRADGPEAMRPVGEVEFANGIAAMSASGLYGETRVAAAIVGLADLCIGADVAPVLDALEAAGGGRFRGIRRQCSWDASDEIYNGRMVDRPHIYLEDKFRQGLAELTRRGLTFDAWCYFTQIEELTDLARAFPETTIILDHLGGPIWTGPYAGRRDEVIAEWRRRTTELATCPNVHAKLGGINMDFVGFGWHLAERPPTSEVLMQANRPFLEHMIEQFGVERCMFESNFPVDKESCSYHVLWNSFKRLTAGYSADERAKLFHDNAARVYRIDA